MKIQCPNCKISSGSTEWNTSTENYYGYVPREGKIENVKIEPFQAWIFVCPNCKGHSYDKNFKELSNKS